MLNRHLAVGLHLPKTTDHMKLNLFIVLSILLCGCSSRREVIEKYTDGSPKKVIDHIDQNKYYIRELYPDGKLEKEKFFKNGLQDSIESYYNKEGRKMAEMTFRNGSRNGITHEFYRNGQIAFEGSCENGKFEGLSTWYYRNGKIQTKSYRHLSADTSSQDFDTTGVLIRAFEHKNEKLVYYNGLGTEISAEEWEKIPFTDQPR